jgi:hypothetical protein
MYTPVKLNVFTAQHDKLKNAITHQKATSIKFNLDSSGDGKHTLLLTRGQIAKIERAKLIGKRNMSIHLSKKQVQANVKHQGGFLGMLAGLAAKALPTVLKGLASGLVSSAVKKVVGGDGLYLHKSGHCVKVEPVKGNGLYLTPRRRLPGVHGDGLYLKRGSTIQDGSGLILGPNSPFKNIPILNLLL